jgi:hypothetical protein
VGVIAPGAVRCSLPVKSLVMDGTTANNDFTAVYFDFAGKKLINTLCNKLSATGCAIRIKG